MKKIFALIISVTMIFLVTACGGQEPTPVEPTPIEVEGLLSKKGAYVNYEYSDHVLNEKGQIIQVKVSGNSNRIDKYEYDEEGRLVKELRGKETWTYTYDENGNLISEFQGDRTFNNTYTFDENGRVLTKKSVNADTNYTMLYSYTYNEDGTIATETQTSDTSVYVITYKYDDNGRVVEETSVKKGESSGMTTKYTYGIVGTYTPIE